MDQSDGANVRRRLSALRKRFDAAPPPRAPLLTFAMVAAPVRDGRIARVSQAIWQRVMAGVSASRAAAAGNRALAMFQACEPADRIARIAGVIGVGAVTNLAMSLVVEQYHFPRRTDLVLPAVVACAAWIVYAMSPVIARAAADKRNE